MARLRLLSRGAVGDTRQGGHPPGGTPADPSSITVHVTEKVAGAVPQGATGLEERPRMTVAGITPDQPWPLADAWGAAIARVPEAIHRR
jgi:hypothetical protein